MAVWPADERCARRAAAQVARSRAKAAAREPRHRSEPRKREAPLALLMTRSRLALSFGEKLDLDLVVGDAPPPATGAVVVPQDVHLILGEVGPLEDTRGDARAGAGRIRRRTGPRSPAPSWWRPPREGSPLLVQAIVYDFDHTPPAREVHVFEALLAAFEEARTRGLRSLAVQPLGTAHAGLDPARFLGPPGPGLLLVRGDGDDPPPRAPAPAFAGGAGPLTRSSCRRWSNGAGASPPPRSPPPAPFTPAASRRRSCRSDSRAAPLRA